MKQPPKTAEYVFYSLGALEEFPLRIGRRMLLEGVELAIFRTTDDGFYALENRNPHPKGGTLAEGIVSGHYLYDPLYDVKLDLQTGQACAPNEGAARIYPVRIVGNQVQVGLPESGA